MSTIALVSVTRVSAVSVYGSGPMRSLSIRDAAAFVATHECDQLLILGAMQPGYLGRESLTPSDLRGWVAELDAAGLDFGWYCHDHGSWIARGGLERAECPQCEHEEGEAAQWAAISDGERAMAEMGALR